jgi:hypothetical protein
LSNPENGYVIVKNKVWDKITIEALNGNECISYLGVSFANRRLAKMKYLVWKVRKIMQLIRRINHGQ